MTTATEPRTDATREPGIRGLARRRPLTMFFVIAYAVTWLLWSPLILLGVPAFNPDTFAPTIWVLPGIAIGVTGTAFLMVGLIDGKPGIRRLASRLISFRHGIQWYLVAILLLPGTAVIVTLILGATDAGAAFALTSLVIYPASYAAHFIFGPLFEETGWRGFALPRMQNKYGPFRGTFYLSLLWATWHFSLYIPSWFGSGDIGQGMFGLGFFTLTVIGMTFIFTWLSNNTQASLALCILLHGSIDGSVTYFQRLAAGGTIAADTSAMLVGFGATIGYFVIATIVLLATRGRLSYPRYQREAEDLDLHPSRHHGERILAG
ncbi:type II CAAX endopeptidase family protein [Microbacterium lacus]|uniref:Type II CAAX endopeptidase family protein n=1 Tax=Microbacterium lacus TaxID=415217 RepID=A0ABN2HC26_9MICO